MKKAIPAGTGKIISLRRFERLVGNTTTLTEGTPPSATNPTVTEVTATLAQYGRIN